MVIIIIINDSCFRVEFFIPHWLAVNLLYEIHAPTVQRSGLRFMHFLSFETSTSIQSQQTTQAGTHAEL